jgi:hypothetical protein
MTATSTSIETRPRDLELKYDGSRGGRSPYVSSSASLSSCTLADIPVQIPESTSDRSGGNNNDNLDLTKGRYRNLWNGNLKKVVRGNAPSMQTRICSSCTLANDIV